MSCRKFLEQLGPELHRFPLRLLRLGTRGLAACEALGLETLGGFAARSEEDFLGLRNCGRKTYETMLGRLREFVTEAHNADLGPEPLDLDLSLHGVIRNQRAIRAFVQLGIRTVGEFLATPRRELLAVRGFGDRTYHEIAQRIRSVASRPRYRILPDELLDLSLRRLKLDPPLLLSLERLGIQRVGALLGIHEGVLIAESGIGDTGLQQLRDAIAEALRKGLAQSDRPRARTFGDFLGNILATLSDDQRELFRHRVGLGCRAEPTFHIAARWKVPEEQLILRESMLRQKIEKDLPEQVAHLRQTVRSELRAFDRIVRPDRIAEGSILHAAARETGDPMLGLRLAAVVCSDEFSMVGEILTDMDPDTFRQLERRLRRLTRSGSLPATLSSIEEDLREVIEPVPREMVIYLLRERLRLTVHIDPKQGEVIRRRSDSVPERLQTVFEEIGTSLDLEDLLFHYRDRFGSGSVTRLLDNLRLDRRFLQVGTKEWSLREAHVDELELVRPEAERISSTIRTIGGRHSVREVAEGEPMSERAEHLVVDLLRKDPTLRDLGRGEFCHREAETSTLVHELRRELRRAMGEVPFSRFLQNKPPQKRRLISSLLRQNRLFISPALDRVDLLENYPFNQDRMRRFLHAVDTALEENGGYCSIGTARAAVEEAGLGGSFLVDHLFLDLLRRHGHYEFLAGDMIAQASLGLIGWIQSQAREVLRVAECALTPDELLNEKPELAEFQTCLIGLMERDPLVHSPDGLHFQVR